jgi:hypothetical protein
MFEGIVKVELSKPVQWEGDDVATIELDFGKLNPTSVIEAERACGGNLSSAFMKATNTEYCTILASYTMRWKQNLSYRVLMKLGMGDFNTVWQTIGAYVLDQDPQKFYDQFTKVEEADVKTGFTSPATKLETE